jgi:hypothetical protein
MLDALARTGPWQVTVGMRMASVADADTLGEINWESAVKFAAPRESHAAPWPPQPAADARDGDDSVSKNTAAFSSESVTWDFSPYLAVVVDQAKDNRILRKCVTGAASTDMGLSKVTLFSGQRAFLCNEAMMPFVMGVHYERGELAAAAQPDVALVCVGRRLDVKPRVVDAQTLDLECRVITSRLGRVDSAKVPGKDITVQNPHVTRQTIAASCRVAPGESLLLAPLGGQSDDDGKGFSFYIITPEWFADDLDGAPSSAASRDGQ